MATTLGLVLAAALLIGASGLPALLLSRVPRAGQLLSTVLVVVGGLLGLGGLSLLPAAGVSLRLPWFLPWGEFSVAIDALGAAFLLPVLAIPPLASIYGLGYWKASEHPGSWRGLGLSFGLLASAMILVVIARDAILFLVAWELMALAAWLASTAESGKAEVRRAGWVYLVATHVGTLCLFAMFALWNASTGSYALGAADSPALREASAAVFALALVGFGLKAGLMPLHVWLPASHANAPSHVSAVMSAVMLKMGVYGIARMTALLPAPEAGWGWVLLGVGAITGIGGIAWALGQADLKRILAYSSVENIGIIAMGMGLALLGRSSGRPELVLLGMGGAIIHVWNHALFKSLLFLDAGAVIHATGTRRIDLLGGLSTSMPRAAAFFALGAVAIAALPPLNGFVGEWLLYQGFFRSLAPVGDGATTPSLAAAAAGAAVLAAIGALALAAFVRAFGGIFLGQPRGGKPAVARDPRAAMTLPMLLLALGCLLLGLAPALVLPLADEAARGWGGLAAGTAGLATQADLGGVSSLGAVLVIIVLVVFGVLGLRSRSATARKGSAAAPPTWDCGYAGATSRMQYTASSFGEFPLRGLRFPLLPTRHGPRIESAFPRPSSFASKVPDLVLDRVLLPIIRFLRRLIPAARFMQQGQTQVYLAYVVAVTIILLFVGVGLP